MEYTVDNTIGEAMGNKIVEKTYEFYQMLGAKSQWKSARVQRVRVNEIAFDSDISMQLAKLTKLITTIRIVKNK